LDDVPAKRAADDAALQATITAAYDTLSAAGIPAHAVGLARARRWLGRPDADDLAARADALARLWQLLPAQARPLPEISHALFDDTHRLDRDADLGRVAARLLAAATADPNTAADAADQALAVTQWRQVWASYGDQLRRGVVHGPGPRPHPGRYVGRRRDIAGGGGMRRAGVADGAVAARRLETSLGHAGRAGL
jgi:hypothetical protein